MLYAGAGFLLGTTLTVGGYLVDYHELYGRMPERWTPGLLRGLHDATPVHYFADLFPLLLALTAGIAGWLQDRVIYYSRRLEDLVERRTHDLRRSEERYALAAAGANDGLWDWDLRRGNVYFSPRWKEMAGHREDDMEGRIEEWFQRIHPDEIEEVKAAMEAHLAGLTDGFEAEYRLRHALGGYRWMRGRGVAVRDSDGRAVRIAGSQMDVHEARYMEEQLRYLALHDPLTDLPNRTLFLDRLRQAMLRRRAASTRKRIAVLYVGIDRLRKVAETLGQDRADLLIKEAARRLGGVVEAFGSDRAGGSPIFLSRLGGDEFGILLEIRGGARRTVGLAERVLEAFERPVQIGPDCLRLTVGLGVSFATTGNPERFIRAAHSAMCRAKAKGRARFEIFEETAQASVREALALETDLYHALENGDLHLCFQPIVRLRTGRLAGFEALLRWEHPSRGAISPGAFIPLAEEAGLIEGIGLFVLRNTFQVVRSWQDRFPRWKNLTVNVNLSTRHLHHPDLTSDLESLLQETGADPRRIHLEITESSLLEDPQNVVASLKKLRKQGFRLAMDDFGTGYSSLSMLHELPLDILKVDAQFVVRLGTIDDGSSKLVRTIVSLAHSLGMAVVAEGIERRRQLEELRRLRCDYGQGFLLGKPSLREEVESAHLAHSSSTEAPRIR